MWEITGPLVMRTHGNIYIFVEHVKGKTKTLEKDVLNVVNIAINSTHCH